MIEEMIIENAGIIAILAGVAVALYGKPYVGVIVKLLGNIDQTKIKDLIEVYGPKTLYEILSLETDNSIDFKASSDMPKLLSVAKSGQLDQVYAMVTNKEFDKVQAIFNTGRVSDLEKVFEKTNLDSLLKAIDDQEFFNRLQAFNGGEMNPIQKERAAANLCSIIK